MISPIIILSLSWQHMPNCCYRTLSLSEVKKSPELMRGVGSGIKELKTL